MINKDRLLIKTTKKFKKQDKNQPNKKDTNISVPLPYVHGLSEKLTNIFHSHGVGTYHKPYNTIRSLLVHPKDKTRIATSVGLRSKYHAQIVMPNMCERLAEPCQ